jgi:hypothetical protein
VNPSSLLAIAALLAGLSISKAEDDAPLPPAAENTLKALETALERNWTAYDRQNSKDIETAVRLLEKLKVDATKRGDLQGAVAIDKLIKDTRSKAVTNIVEQRMEAGLGDSTDRDLISKKLVGEWKLYDPRAPGEWSATITITPDLKYTCVGSGGGLDEREGRVIIRAGKAIIAPYGFDLATLSTGKVSGAKDAKGNPRVLELKK